MLYGRDSGISGSLFQVTWILILGLPSSKLWPLRLQTLLAGYPTRNPSRELATGLRLIRIQHCATSELVWWFVVFLLSNYNSRDKTGTTIQLGRVCVLAFLCEYVFAAKRSKSTFYKLKTLLKLQHALALLSKLHLEIQPFSPGLNPSTYKPWKTQHQYPLRINSVILASKFKYRVFQQIWESIHEQSLPSEIQITEGKGKEMELLEYKQFICYFEYHERRRALVCIYFCFYLLQKLLEKVFQLISKLCNRYIFKKSNKPLPPLETTRQR